jgi:high-affinity iron transporter
VHEFTEAGWLPLTPVAFDLSAVLGERGPVGSVLAGLFGYRSAPTWSELAAYFGYLVPVLILFLLPSLVPARPRMVSESVDVTGPSRT